MFHAVYKGIGSGSGFAIGPAVIVQRGELAVPRSELKASDVEKEIRRFRRAVAVAHEQLNRIRAAIAKVMGDDAAAIIDAQLLLLNDPSCIDETERLILKKLVNAEYAFDTVIQSIVESLSESDNDVFRERVQDFHDIRRRVLANLMGLKHQVIPSPRRRSILIISHLAPSETAHLFGSKFVGLVTEAGGFTSHIAIMARTMDLPAVLGVEGVTDAVRDGDTVIVDSMRGQVVVNPDDATRREFQSKQRLYRRRRSFVMKAVPLEPVTKDGHRITVAANMELPEEVPLAKHYGAEGIGLFRTELLYMSGEALPSEEQQFEIYKSIAEKVAPHSAIIRTFDVGGDKLAGVLGHHYEPNPFLGLRAIRIGLKYPDILKVQLRAILRASAFGKIKIMFPMISLPEEMQLARQIVADIMDELSRKGIPFDENIEVGAMVEVPSAAILSRKLAVYCDFFSIGTNDLIQYTLAADRGNPRVAHIYQSYQPAVLKLIKFTIDSAHLAGRWVGVCGEMAGELRAIPMLLGMGVDELSTVPARVPLVKQVVRHLRFEDARKIAEQVLQFDTQEEVISFLDEQVKRFLPKTMWEM